MGPAVASRYCSWSRGGVCGLGGRVAIRGAAGSPAGAAFTSVLVISVVPLGATRAGATYWDAGETRDFCLLDRVQRIELR
jgi:hypothetical protein